MKSAIQKRVLMQSEMAEGRVRNFGSKHVPRCGAPKHKSGVDSVALVP